jgi:hypothetical protein
MSKIQEFWAKLTPTQRTIIATVVDIKINHLNMARRLKVAEYVARGDSDFLVANVHKKISEYLENNSAVTVEELLREFSV